jgi:hypothetical protein
MRINAITPYIVPTTFSAAKTLPQQPADTFETPFQKIPANTFLKINPVSELLENSVIKKEIRQAYDEVWENFTVKNAETLAKIKLEKPELIFNKDGDADDLAIYCGMFNDISVRADNLDRYVIIGKDNDFWLDNRKYIKKYIRENGITPANTYLWDEKITNTKQFVNSGKNFFAKLTPREIAQITKPVLAHELEHCLQLHVLLNTEDISKEKIIDNLNKNAGQDVREEKGFDETYIAQYESEKVFKKSEDFPYTGSPMKCSIEQHWLCWDKDDDGELYDIDVNEIGAELAYAVEIKDVIERNKGKKISAIAATEGQWQSAETQDRLKRSLEHYSIS